MADFDDGFDTFDLDDLDAALDGVAADSEKPALDYSKFENIEEPDDEPLDGDDGGGDEEPEEREMTEEEEWQWRQMVVAAGMEDELRELQVCVRTCVCESRWDAHYAIS